MKFCNILMLVAVITMAGFEPGWAANVYVAESALGANTGADAADAHPITWLNTSANWGGGINQVGPGSTVCLCGILTNAITLQSGGTVDSPLTILFQTNAKFSAPTWTGTIINDSGQSFVIIDGGSNGIIEATANGSGLSYSNTMTAVAVTSASGVIVQNLTVQNLYVMSNGKGGILGTDQKSCGAGVVLTGTGIGNDVVTNCIFHDMFEGFGGAYGAGCSNITVTHCTAYNCNWGGSLGDSSSSATLNGITVDHCHFYNWRNWDNNTDNHHHNGFFTWAMSGGWVSNVCYLNNYVGPGFGVQNSSGLFVQGNVFNLLAYNNVFDASDGTCPADGLLYIDLQKIAGPSSAYVFNNHFIGGAGANVAGINADGDLYGSNSSYFYFMNNVYMSNRYAIIWFRNAASTLVDDTNMYYGCNAKPFAASANSSGGSVTLAAWQSYGYDQASTTKNPSLNRYFATHTNSLVLGAGANLPPIGYNNVFHPKLQTYFNPQTGSLLVGAGANLTAFGITNDFGGHPRPSAGNWTIGAYEGTVPKTGDGDKFSPGQ